MSTRKHYTGAARKALVDYYLSSFEPQGIKRSTFARAQGINEDAFLGWVEAHSLGIDITKRGFFAQLRAKANGTNEVAEPAQSEPVTPLDSVTQTAASRFYAVKRTFEEHIKAWFDAQTDSLRAERDAALAEAAALREQLDAISALLRK